MHRGSQWATPTEDGEGGQPEAAAGTAGGVLCGHSPGRSDGGGLNPNTGSALRAECGSSPLCADAGQVKESLLLPEEAGDGVSSRGGSGQGGEAS